MCGSELLCLRGRNSAQRRGDGLVAGLQTEARKQQLGKSDYGRDCPEMGKVNEEGQSLVYANSATMVVLV